jgi:outer membrane lipoprotein-sorting protein
MTRSLFLFGASVALACAATAARPLLADDAPAAPAPPAVTDAKVKTALTPWADRLAKEHDMTWESSIAVTRSSEQSGQDKPDEVQYTVKGYAEKPDKAYIEVRQSGQLVWVFTTAGDKGYSYDPLAKTYTDLDHFSAPGAAGLSMVTGSAFTNNDPASYLTAGIPVDLTFTVTKNDTGTHIDGSGQVTAAPEKGKDGPTVFQKTTVSMLMNAKTGLLDTAHATLAISYVPDSKTPASDAKTLSTFSTTETITKLDFPKSLPASTFTWQPPADAKLTTPPPATPAGNAPAAQ